MTDPFIKLVSNAFQEKFEGKIVQESYKPKTKDYRTTLEKKPDEPLVLFGWEETGRIVKQANELNFGNQILGIDTFASEDFRENTGRNYNGLKFTFWKGQENKNYQYLISNFKKKYGKKPQNKLFTATGYDAMLVLSKTLKSCGKEIDCIKKNLEKRTLSGATGKIDVDKDNITRDIQESIFTYRSGEIKRIK